MFNKPTNLKKLNDLIKQKDTMPEDEYLEKLLAFREEIKRGIVNLGQENLIQHNNLETIQEILNPN
ncbi:MAG: hypothetical protein ACM31G_07090 [Flavobacteriales bacterium]